MKVIKQTIYTFCIVCPLCFLCYYKGYIKGQEKQQTTEDVKEYIEDIEYCNNIVVEPLSPDDPNFHLNLGWHDAERVPGIFLTWEDTPL